jgi:hypothetical protein
MVEDIDSAVEAVGKLSKSVVRAAAAKLAERFTDRHIAEDYIRINRQLLSRSSTQAAA